MARPLLDNPASALVRFRLTPANKIRLVRKAKAAGLSLSAYLLACGLRGLK